MSLGLARKIWLRQNRERCPVEQPVENWTGSFPLPLALRDYYKQVGPNELYCFEDTGLVLRLPSLKELVQFQYGILESVRPSGSTEPGIHPAWGPERLAVAIHHTNPFVFHSESEHVTFNTRGLRAGAGWQTVAKLSSLAEMMIFFGVLEETISQLVHCTGEVDDQPTEFLQQLIDATSEYVERGIATKLLTVMFG